VPGKGEVRLGLNAFGHQHPEVPTRGTTGRLPHQRRLPDARIPAHDQRRALGVNVR
jgi:hypothetical protein